MISSVAPPITAAELSLGAGVWSRRVRFLDLGCLVVSLLAAATETYLLLQDGGALGDCVGLALILIGIGLIRIRLRIGPHSPATHLWLGTALVALGPLSATALGGDPLVSWTIVVFTAFSITLRGLPGALVGGILGAAAYLAVIGSDGLGAVDPTAFIALTCTFTAAATGSALRSYVRYRTEFAERTRQTLASRDAETHQRVAEERLRIARDLHDIVGHEIAVLNIHLSVAQVNLPIDAVRARTSLESARTSVQSVLGETQRILHVLRTEHGDGSLGTPNAQFDRIPDLLGGFQRAGADIDADLCAVPAQLDPEVSTAAYRLLEEALTNSQKHGEGPVEVVTSTRGPDLRITITNAKRVDAAPPVRRGYGLVGMRERVTSAGGRLVLRDEEATFAVEATLRIDGSAHS
ncbi:sensor histidine kinase [Rathayibacter sp. VKM Ac-2857]|uniref:sensor histidine kinase n=1 Tax=Rathayibacter sp. VKM Ac-2857 TaxID=2739020 RepID=UPI001565997A|nr:histidine kinase [Rathayibacter sp. VKM Ac-2857]NQX16641.1 histidine kinase [Rathayibacter sp. VKM Ac-2857]